VSMSFCMLSSRKNPMRHSRHDVAEAMWTTSVKANVRPHASGDLKAGGLSAGERYLHDEMAPSGFLPAGRAWAGALGHADGCGSVVHAPVVDAPHQDRHQQRRGG
jgi:hypothetical protein